MMMTLGILKKDLISIRHWETLRETDNRILELIENLIKYLEEKEKQNG